MNIPTFRRIDDFLYMKDAHFDHLIRSADYDFIQYGIGDVHDYLMSTDWKPDPIMIQLTGSTIGIEHFPFETPGHSIISIHTDRQERRERIEQIKKCRVSKYGDPVDRWKLVLKQPGNVHVLFVGTRAETDIAMEHVMKVLDRHA